MKSDLSKEKISDVLDLFSPMLYYGRVEDLNQSITKQITELFTNYVKDNEARFKLKSWL